jgi:hypothetical protein
MATSDAAIKFDLWWIVDYVEYFAYITCSCCPVKGNAGASLAKAVTCTGHIVTLGVHRYCDESSTMDISNVGQLSYLTKDYGIY